MVNKRIRNAVLGCNLKNNRMISICFQGKPFSIRVIQVCVPSSNAEEAEVDQGLTLHKYMFYFSKMAQIIPDLLDLAIMVLYIFY